MSNIPDEPITRVEQYLAAIEKKMNGIGGNYELPIANENELGGVKAKVKTTETIVIAIDKEGNLFAPAPLTIAQIKEITGGN